MRGIAFAVCLSLLASGCVFQGKGKIEIAARGLASTQNPSAPPSNLPSGTGKIQVNWNPSREKAVNSIGGGYRVYYSTAGAIDSATPFKNVSYASGAAAPTSVLITGLGSARWVISVQAYSALNPAGSAVFQTSVVMP